MRYAILFVFAAICFGSTHSNEFQTRIVSGTAAAIGQFPWQVILKKDYYDDLLCGGSIISANWILTAGHCVYGLSSIYVVCGTTQLDNDGALNMTSTSLFLHPQYNPNNLNNDIALILLPKALTFSSTISPIALVSSSQATNSFIGRKAIISGFGLTDDDYLDNSPNLLWATVTIINNKRCADLYGKDVVLSSTLCAIGAYNSTMSICSGDSGGPLIIYNSLNIPIQIGINSFAAQDMCTAKYPSGYLRVSSYLGFISQITGLTLS